MPNPDLLWEWEGTMLAGDPITTAFGEAQADWAKGLQAFRIAIDLLPEAEGAEWVLLARRTSAANIDKVTMYAHKPSATGVLETLQLTMESKFTVKRFKYQDLMTIGLLITVTIPASTVKDTFLLAPNEFEQGFNEELMVRRAAERTAENLDNSPL